MIHHALTPTSTSPATNAGAQHTSSPSEKSWFRTREGRRYGWEIAVIVIAKLLMLAVLWFVFIKPWIPDAPRGSGVKQIYQSATPANRHD